MKKAIYIGELALNVAICPDGSAQTGIGDWAVNAAILDGKMGLPTLWMGEAAADAVGDHIISVLEKAGVDCKSVDRFTEGVSPVRIFPAEDHAKAVDHANYPSEPVNAIWPRVDEGDVVIYGSYMTLEDRDHQSLLDFLNNAKARKAILVYLPYFEATQVPRITRVMPQIFDNLELADLVVARDKELRAIFNEKNLEGIFKSHILFYCKRMLWLEPQEKLLRFFDGEQSWTKECHPTDNTEFQWSAGALAGAIRCLVEDRHDPDDIMNTANETAHSELAATIVHPCQK